MENILHLDEGTHKLRDEIVGGNSGKQVRENNGLFPRTSVIGGYGYHVDKNGVSQLDEVVFDTHNMIPLGGVQYSFEQVFGIAGPVETGYLNDLMGIGAQTTTATAVKDVYPDGHHVCLFGVGTGGALNNNNTVLPVKYTERAIVDMVPFRVVNAPLTGQEEKQYFGKKTEEGKICYYLKAFTSKSIKHLYLDAGSTGEGTTVDSSVWTSTRTDPIESFVEIILTISMKDVKEHFTRTGNIEDARVNSIALFTGVMNATANDYEKIKMYSKLNIRTEPLSLNKELTIIYRVYGK